MGPLRSRVDDFHAEVRDASDDADLADDLVRVVPDLLGRRGPRRYLVAFLQPAELRAGGFGGSYAELEADDGDVELCGPAASTT
ncbi:DUF4012 domain-containing protein [Aquihabitans sp. G128]|uniref:DUF4012 domain-containing protein n=1 Tax=Aquihabitans sp. G128 TaxID=2849779 RepID=UPI001C230502|nr:DUF4012 domain-containing protein [Aquihabitans sp. G128]QXC61272.1 DUF4012 domain-containing protein [Aquihabitans sp. G128]